MRTVTSSSPFGTLIRSYPCTQPSIWMNFLTCFLAYLVSSCSLVGSSTLHPLFVSLVFFVSLTLFCISGSPPLSEREGSPLHSPRTTRCSRGRAELSNPDTRSTSPPGLACQPP